MFFYIKNKNFINLPNQKPLILKFWFLSTLWILKRYIKVLVFSATAVLLD